ncbi:acyltransferase [Magnetospira sp. QH-2]|uniref:acyltransferase family protein n=1 Tax=Magnetospira sp. (strain QH-2) TaxID=1288970 RepID=UPI0003E80A5D|nr:acyltransferase [Magnetospira sp. QH-2]CCQ74355.1 putative Acyltransferase 3(Membrane-bound) [Magnetospira sp. QH-2]
MKPYLDSLTVLRGLFCLWVMLHNYRTIIQDLSFVSDPAFLRDGYLAVDAFFVLSGFILSYVYEGDFKGGLGTKYRHFMVSRIARIYPLHVFSLLVVLALVLISFAFFDRSYVSLFDLGDNLSMIYFVAHLGLFHAWGWAETNSWNTPAWSISVEFLCYLLFPLLFMGVRAVCRMWSRGAFAVAAALALMVVPPLVILGGFDQPSLDVSQDLGVIRGLCGFAGGMFVFQASRSLPSSDQGLGALLVLLSLYFLPLMLWETGWLISLFLTPFLILLMARVRLKSGPIERGLIGIGNISYSIYMLHFIPLLVKERLFGAMRTDAEIMAMLGVVFGAILIAAMMTNRWIEKPARYAIRSRFRT